MSFGTEISVGRKCTENGKWFFRWLVNAQMYELWYH